MVLRKDPSVGFGSPPLRITRCGEFSDFLRAASNFARDSLKDDRVAPVDLAGGGDVGIDLVVFDEDLEVDFLFSVLADEGDDLDAKSAVAEDRRLEEDLVEALLLPSDADRLYLGLPLELLL